MNGESVALLTPLTPDVETVIESDILSAKSVAKSDESKESLSVVSPEAEDEAALLVSRSAEPLADGAALNVRHLIIIVYDSFDVAFLFLCRRWKCCQKLWAVVAY